jgi:hypothetical protein
MRTDLTTSLAEYYALVQNFQLLDITYPEAFEQSISATQKEYFQIEEATFNKSKVEKESEGLVRRA